jgi:hypothetical protein
MYCNRLQLHADTHLALVHQLLDLLKRLLNGDLTQQGRVNRVLEHVD